MLYIDLAPFIYAWFIGKDINAEIVTQTLIFNIPDKEEIKQKNEGVGTAIQSFGKSAAVGELSSAE